LPRVAYLLDIPAAVKWVSAEPLLGPIDFRPYLGEGKIEWVITGAESAAKDKRREMSLDCVRDIDEQCREFGAVHYYKQYYNGTKLVYDGMLDGNYRQAWPRRKELAMI
jgi:protein gp37